jgi:hypothetical protein
MILLKGTNAAKLFAKGIYDVDRVKITVSTTGYLFNDTQEAREVLKNVTLTAYESLNYVK